MKENVPYTLHELLNLLEKLKNNEEIHFNFVSALYCLAHEVKNLRCETFSGFVNFSAEEMILRDLKKDE